MTDAIQKAAQTLATENGATRDIAIGLAVYLLYLLCTAWVVIAGLHARQISGATVVRGALLVVLTFLLAQILNGLVSDPRPYMTAHTQPLTPVGHDNGFPSDHTLLAAALTAGLWWIDRRALWAFAVGTLLIALGRLGIGAHHTLDVVGSMGIVAVAAVGVAQIQLPPSWNRPLVSSRQRSEMARAKR